MAKKMAVIAGTFNPVTKAHIAMGKIAKTELGNDLLVVYVPAKDHFLKSWKQMGNEDIIPEQDRISLLKKALEQYGFFLDSCEIDGVVSGRTYNTLKYLAGKYEIPEKDVYFVCGSDKLQELQQWYRADELLSNFRFMVIGRTNDQPEMLIRRNAFLSKYSKSFHLVQGTESLKYVSATTVRNAIKNGQTKIIKTLVPEILYPEIERMVHHVL